MFAILPGLRIFVQILLHLAHFRQVLIPIPSL